MTNSTSRPAQGSLCWWHPDRQAYWIVNLGWSGDKDTPACNACKEKIEGDPVRLQRASIWPIENKETDDE